MVVLLLSIPPLVGEGVAAAADVVAAVPTPPTPHNAAARLVVAPSPDKNLDDADVMFGDESDDDAKDMKKEYTFKPKYRGGRSRKRTVDKDDEEEEDESESENSNE